jgi:hypothetical protein
VKAIGNSGVRYVVFLSNIGADLPEGLARLRAFTRRRSACGSCQTSTRSSCVQRHFSKTSTRSWV